MRTMVWTCDRCRATVEIPQEIVIVTDFSPAALVKNPKEWGHLPNWEQFHDDESVADVCPNCVTPGERADRLFREVAGWRLFGPEE
jgi:hypothetical protein